MTDPGNTNRGAEEANLTDTAMPSAARPESVASHGQNTAISTSSTSNVSGAPTVSASRPSSFSTFSSYQNAPQEASHNAPQTSDNAPGAYWADNDGDNVLAPSVGESQASTRSLVAARVVAMLPARDRLAMVLAAISLLLAGALVAVLVLFVFVEDEDGKNSPEPTETLGFSSTTLARIIELGSLHCGIPDQKQGFAFPSTGNEEYIGFDVDLVSNALVAFLPAPSVHFKSHLWLSILCYSRFLH